MSIVCEKVLDKKQKNNESYDTSPVQKSNSLFWKAHRERACLFASYPNRIKGSLSIEAAIVFPIFLFLCMGILYFILIFSLQTSIQENIEEIAEEVSKTYYCMACYEGLTEQEKQEVKSEAAWEKWLKKSISVIALQERFVQKIGKVRLNNSYLIGGRYGVSFGESVWNQDTGRIDIVVHYTVKIPFLPEQVSKYSFKQRCKTRAWIGDRKNIDHLETVYVTDTGNVYHTNRDCTHLQLSIEQIDAVQLQTKKNTRGSYYRGCKECIDNSRRGVRYYITKQGECYHASLACNGLKRTVYLVNKEEVEEKVLCKRCEESR